MNASERGGSLRSGSVGKRGRVEGCKDSFDSGWVGFVFCLLIDSFLFFWVWIFGDFFRFSVE